MRKEKITPDLLWDHVQHVVPRHEHAYLIFDDTVLDQKSAKKIELTRRHYSGNEHRVIRGIGLVSCVYVNPETRQFWVINYRVYDPDGDGKTKLEHGSQMLNNLVIHQQLPFNALLNG